MPSRRRTYASSEDGKRTGDGSGVGFFIPLPPELAEQFPPLGDEDRSDPHITYLYIGNVAPARREALLEASAGAFDDVRGPVRAVLTDLEYFVHPDKGRRVAVARWRFSHDLSGIRWALRDRLLEAGFDVDDSFPLIYRPHTTLAYLDGLDSVYEGPLPSGEFLFGSVEVWGLPRKVEEIHFGDVAGRVARRRTTAMSSGASIALMKFLSEAARRLGVARHIYVVGGAVRNFVIGQPIKDIDVVVDSVALGGKDSAWFAGELRRAIPADTHLVTNKYGVAILTIKGDWIVDGDNLRGEDIEIANARSESYGEGGYKPDEVDPATIEEDVARREFTFNTLMWRLLDLAHGPEKAEIVDLTGCGMRDLRDGVMKCPRDPDVVFSDDPSRMIRAVKFILKYGFRISPDVDAAIRRNREKIRNIPAAHLSNMIIEMFYEGGYGKAALVKMRDLGLLDVVRDIARDDRAFREALGNWADRKADLGFVFDLIDLGMPAGKTISFLGDRDRARLREITVGMGADESRVFVEILAQPGKGLDMPSLIAELGLKGREIQALTDRIRYSLLEDPSLASSPGRLEAAVRGGFGKTAETFQFDVGEHVLYGKYKNKRGIIRSFGADPHGNPTIVVEPVPKGRKQDKVIQLFRVWKDRSPMPTTVGRVAARWISKVSMEFPSEEALKKYLSEHPKADRSVHWVKGEGEDGAKDEGKDEGEKKDEGGGKPEAKAPKIEAFVKEWKGSRENDLEALSTGDFKPKKLEGRLAPKHVSEISKNAKGTLKIYSRSIPGDDVDDIHEFIDDQTELLKQAVEDGSIKDVDADKVSGLFTEAIKNLVYQTHESYRHQLGDHGIRHIQGNIRVQNQIFDVLGGHGKKTSPRDRLLAAMVMANHDLGYTAAPARADIRFSGKHKEYGVGLFESELKDDYRDVFGDEDVDRMQEYIKTHDSADIDWDSDPVGSAIRVADNTALYQKEKLPALFRFVPGAIDVLEEIGQAACPDHPKCEGKPDLGKVDELKKKLDGMVDSSKMSPKIKEALKVAAGEVSAKTPKFTLGMLGGHLGKMSFDGKTLYIKVKKDEYATRLNGLFNLGQEQFGKFADEFGIDKNEAKKMEEFAFKRDGKTVLKVNLED